MTHTGRAFVKIHPNARVVRGVRVDPRTENKRSRVFLEISLFEMRVCPRVVVTDRSRRTSTDARRRTGVRSARAASSTGIERGTLAGALAAQAGASGGAGGCVPRLPSAADAADAFPGDETSA